MFAIRKFFVCDVRKPHDENFGMPEILGIAMTYQLLTWREPRRQLCDGIPQTAGAHGRCLLTSKELTIKVKTSSDEPLAAIPADNPRVVWNA